MTKKRKQCTETVCVRPGFSLRCDRDAGHPCDHSHELETRPDSRRVILIRWRDLAAREAS